MNRKVIFIIVAVFFALMAGGCGHSSSVSISSVEQNRTSEAVETVDEAAEKPEQREKEQRTQGTAGTGEVAQQSAHYLDYSNEAFDAAKNKKRVYFFHAKWCPSCKAANAEFIGNLDKIPTDVVLFKTDYDTEVALEKEYSVTYQHTFVYVDAAGKEIKKWNGGGVAELATNTSVGKQ